MSCNNTFEEISAGAISSSMPKCIAILVNVGEQGHIYANLQNMFSAQNYKVYVVNTTLSKLPQVLQRCGELSIPTIVNCGEELPAPETLLPGNSPFTAAIISPGSYDNTPKKGEDIISYTLQNPCATNVAYIGFQGYYFSPDKLRSLRSRYFEDMRLGALRENISLVEPLLRDTQHTFIDLGSVRHSDYPLNTSQNPNGLYAEEICQIARYIGFGQRIKSLFIYGEPPAENSVVTCNKLVAEIIWHLCEAISSNIIENPQENEEDEHYIRKIISLGENGEEIIFVNSLNTDRWWMEILSPNSTKPILVPCSASDYKAACCGEVPLRWLFFYQKLTIL